MAKEISSTLVAMKSASGRGRAESIRDVVDAYRRLYGSVQRFVLMLTGDRLDVVSGGRCGSPSLNQLLSILADHAKAASFARLRDLKAAIEDARPAEQLRDAIFADASSNDVSALRKVVTELERLDAAFVGLCVGHVLEQHASVDSGGAAAGADQSSLAGRRAAAAVTNAAARPRRALASASTTAGTRPRKARAAEPGLAR
jgi:hypothetical protein